jgi:4-hydroxy-3-polyprenylbenzoate decarboxylase
MRDLRDYMAALESHGQLERLSGVDLDLELGGISYLVRRDRLGTAVLFDEFDDRMPGARMLTNILDTPTQVTLALGYEPTDDIREAIRLHKERGSTTETRPVDHVDDGPVLDNVQRGDDVDLTAFPAPLWTEHDGGRYIGTADAVVTRHAETGERNLGTYRVQVHGPQTATLNIRPSRDGGAHRRSYFEQGEPFPAAVSLGHHPDIFMAGNERLPAGVDELEYVSARRDQPLEVVEGEVTGLPFPSRSEIVIEGHVYPEADELTEGPFAEFTGYYGAGETNQRPFVVERIYHRDDPIVTGYNNVPVAAGAMSVIRSAPKLWNQLEQAGIGGIDQVNTVLPGVLFEVISVDQQYPGHSTQVGMAAMSLPAGSWEGRLTVVVDDDVDAFEIDEVLWAMATRVEPTEDIEIIENGMGSRINPRTPPEQKADGDVTIGRLLVDATVPFHWQEEFPPDTRIDPDFESELRERYAETLFAED